MGSDSREPRKPRFRFNFSGKNRRAKNADSRRDDILNSLTRQANPREGTEGEERVLEVVATEDVGQFHSRYQGPDPVPLVPDRIGKNRGSLRGALVIFLGGFLAVWLYGYVTRAYQIPYFQGLTQNPNVQVGLQLVLANPIPSVAISATVLLAAALYIRHRRKS